MADEREVKTSSKKDSHQGWFPWLEKIFAGKRTRNIVSISQQNASSATPSTPEPILDQDSPYLLLKQLSNWIDRGFTVSAIMDNLLRGLIRTLHLDYAAFFVINPLDDSAQLNLQFTASGLKPKVLNSYSVPLINDSILGWVYNQKHEHVLSNIQDSRFKFTDWLLPTTTSQATFPLFSNNQVIGFLDFQAHQPEILENAALDLIRSITIYLRGVLAQSESTPLLQQDNSGQVEQLIRQAKNEVELFSMLRSTLKDSSFVSVLFAVEFDHLSLQFITDPKRTTSSSAIRGLALPLENTLELLGAKNPILNEKLGTSLANGQILSFFSRRGCSSAAIIGILENEEITYILAVGGFEDTPITPEKLASLVDLSKLSGKVLHDLHLIGKLQSRLTELEALASVSKAISVETDLHNLFLLLHSQVKALIGSDVSFAVTIYNKDQDKIEIPFLVEDDQIVNIPPFPLGEGLSSIVIRTQKPLLLRNQQQAISMGAKVIGKVSQSWMGVPLIIGSDVIGTMMVQDSEHEDRFDETDLNVFLTLSPQIAVAIRNAQLFNQVEGSLSQHKLLHRITVETAAANTIGEAIQTTVDLLQQDFKGSKIAVYLKDNRDILTIQYSAGFELEMVAGLTIPIGQGIIGMAAKNQKNTIVNDVTQESSYITLDPTVQSEMAIPITFKGEVLGVLDIELPEKNAFLSNEEDIFGTLGNNLGAVIASARLLENVRVQIALQQQLFDATSKIRQSVDMKSIMEISASEIGRILGARRVSIRINPDLSLIQTGEPVSISGGGNGPQSVMEVSE